MSEWKVVTKAEAKEGHIHLAYINGTFLPSYQLVAKGLRDGKWRLEGMRHNGRREIPKGWIGKLWELPPP
jgi:hypothetical protein